MSDISKMRRVIWVSPLSGKLTYGTFPRSTPDAKKIEILEHCKQSVERQHGVEIAATVKLSK